MSQLDPILRAELAQRNADHAAEWYVLVNDDQAEDLAAGFVPQSVKAMVRAMLDWREEDRRRALRPVRAPKKASGGRGKSIGDCSDSSPSR